MTCDNQHDYVVQLFRTIICQVSDELTPQLQKANSYVQGIRYEHGHPLEIVETLQQLDADPQSRFSRLPMIMLFQDLDEQVGAEPGILCTINPTFAIVTGTDVNFKAQQRYSETFKPILYPIFRAFVKALEQSPEIRSYGQIQGTKTDRLYWGSKYAAQNGTANQMSDFLDAIEFKPTITIYKNDCDEKNTFFTGHSVRGCRC